MRYRHRELSSPSPRLRPARSGISQRSGGTVVELIAYEGASVEPAPQKEHLGYRVIALEVDDMQKATDYLKTKSVEVVQRHERF